ncbi:MAG: hypothetical protein ABW278_05325 [Steroidobacteraceae bacterium]
MEFRRNDYGFPVTDDRIPLHTSDATNSRIYDRTLRNLRPFVGASHSAINARIAELHREWDIERTMGASGAGLALLGFALGLTVDRKYFALPALVAASLFQHAVQGWSPPLPVLRRVGVRTSAEIHGEILALRILRDDFSIRARGAEAALSLALAQ